MSYRNFFLLAAASLSINTGSVFAQYYQPQYNPPSFFSPGGGASPVVVPPTVIMPGDQSSSKKSCRENVIDLFIISWRTTSGDCT
jgi:hypothetical protein